MTTWEQAFKQTFPSTLTLAQAMNRNPEELEAGLLDRLVQQGLVAPRVATEQEYKALMRRTLERWLNGQGQ